MACTSVILNEWAGRIVAEQAIPKLTVALCQGGGLDKGRVIVCSPNGTTNAELLRLLRFVLGEVESIENRTGPSAPAESIPLNENSPRVGGG